MYGKIFSKNRYSRGIVSLGRIALTLSTLVPVSLTTPSVPTVVRVLLPDEPRGKKRIVNYFKRLMYRDTAIALYNPLLGRHPRAKPSTRTAYPAAAAAARILLVFTLETTCRAYIVRIRYYYGGYIFCFLDSLHGIMLCVGDATPSARAQQ